MHDNNKYCKKYNTQLNDTSKYHLADNKKRLARTYSQLTNTLQNL